MFSLLMFLSVVGVQGSTATADLRYACAIGSVELAKSAILRGADISAGWPEANPNMLQILLDRGWSVAPIRGRSYAHLIVDEFEKQGDPWGYGGGRPISGPTSKLTRPPDTDFFECLKIYCSSGGTVLSALEDDHPMGYGLKGQIPLAMAIDFAESNGGKKRHHMRPMVEILTVLTASELIERVIPPAWIGYSISQLEPQGPD